MGRAVGAEVVVAGEVGSLGGAYMVYLRLVEENGNVLRSASGVLDPSQPGLRDAARGLALRLLEPARYSGTVRLTVDVPNAWIHLDGRRLARSPAGPLRDVSVGTHAVRVTHEAYRDFVRFVEVPFDGTVDVAVKLSAYPVRAEQMRLVGTADDSQPLTDRELPWYRRWWAMTAFGAVVLAGATTTAAIIARRTVPRDAEIVVHAPP
jgi:hypothetical protein